MKNLITFILFAFIAANLFPQSTPPKREFRAAWVATVTNLDWPSSPGLPVATQKQELINLLDELNRDGVNTIIFQIRTECDAFYSSSFDPWSYWLTGSQGTAPFPYYDPLEFAVDEAHKRGMELHAWFNPYRAERSVGNYATATNHVTKAHPEWVLQIGTFKFLNPGLPDVRNYVSSVIYDVVSRYDVDGVHFDDYFYPYPPNNMTATSANDALDNAAFAADPRGFTNKYNWRRDNVNILVKQVYDTIQTVKPWVKFGISPFGIWQPGYPAGITGMNAYTDIYCDAISWLQKKSIDYLTPQLYWPFGGGQDYGKLQPWWADSVGAHGLHYYPGHAYYRVSSWPSASELPNQIRLDRKNSKTQGGVFFRAKNFPENPKGVTDTLRNDLYRYKALLPIMNWKDVVKPNTIRNLRYERLANGQAGLKWDIPVTASDGDSASRYVVYRFDYASVQPGDLNNPARILSIEGSRQSIPAPPTSGQAYYIVTALDRNYNESNPVYPILVNPPPVPVLEYPINYAINIEDSVIFKWKYPAHSSSYRLQVSTDSTFASNIIYDQSNIIDTMKMVTVLTGQQKYYWRVMSFNAGGTSNFSSPFSFTTGYPASTLLAYPLNNTGDIPLDTTLYWYPGKDASEYSLVLARSLDFSPSSIVKDVSGITDTFYSVSGLNPYTFHFWKVRASNQYGNGQWSAVWRFRTVAATGIEDEDLIPTEYALEQNFPNPFNPSTTIRFRIPEAGLTRLKIYNILGQEVAVLVEEYMNPGTYNVEFNTKAMLNQEASGIYIYRLRVNDYSASKKMILMK
jgi:uncharacterized lipoprotein YddW (UPF0748 family)